MASGILPWVAMAMPSAARAGCVEIGEFLVGVADVEQPSAGREARSKLFDDVPDQDVLSAGRERDGLSFGHLDRDAYHLSFLGVTLLERVHRGQIHAQALLPLPAERA